MDSVYIGNRASSVQAGNELKPYSKVVLLAEDANGETTEYTSGDDAGRTLEIELPLLTVDPNDKTQTLDTVRQKMVDRIRQYLSGYTYTPYEASGAILNPAAELGDGITVGGVYSVLAYQDISFGPLMRSTVSAPGEDETEEEYPYESPTERKLSRMAKSITSLTVQEGKIELSVQDMENQIGQTLRVAADGVTITNADGDTLEIDGGQLKASSVTADAIKAGELIVGDKVTMGSGAVIAWGNLDNNVQGTINSKSTITESQVHTYISQDLVASPVIAGGKFANINATKTNITMWMEIGSSADEDEYSIGNYSLQLKETFGNNTYNIFSVYRGDFADVVFGVYNKSFFKVDGTADHQKMYIENMPLIIGLSNTTSQYAPIQALYGTSVPSSLLPGQIYFVKSS